MIGDSRDRQALVAALAGAEAVVSALGPKGKDHQLHRQTAAQLVPAMRAAGVRRYIGISGAGVNTAGDRKRARDRVISAGMGVFASRSTTMNRSRVSTRSTVMRRGDLAVFLTDVLEQGLYCRQAPFVATADPRR